MHAGSTWKWKMARMAGSRSEAFGKRARRRWPLFSLFIHCPLSTSSAPGKQHGAGIVGSQAALPAVFDTAGPDDGGDQVHARREYVDHSPRTERMIMFEPHALRAGVAHPSRHHQRLFTFHADDHLLIGKTARRGAPLHLRLRRCATQHLFEHTGPPLRTGNCAWFSLRRRCARRRGKLPNRDYQWRSDFPNWSEFSFCLVQAEPGSTIVLTRTPRLAGPAGNFFVVGRNDRKEASCSATSADLR